MSLCSNELARDQTSRRRRRTTCRLAVSKLTLSVTDNPPPFSVALLLAAVVSTNDKTDNHRVQQDVVGIGQDASPLSALVARGGGRGEVGKGEGWRLICNCVHNELFFSGNSLVLFGVKSVLRAQVFGVEINPSERG